MPLKGGKVPGRQPRESTWKKLGEAAALSVLLYCPHFRCLILPSLLWIRASLLAVAGETVVDNCMAGFNSSIFA
mgnify:CR=1 FL=1